MSSPFRFLILLSIIAVLIIGLFDYLRNYEKNECEMTYMYTPPQYLRIALDSDVTKQFPKYGLYFYGEGKYAEQAKQSGFRLSGIPVLFIPGNAGSYRQVRSLGSVALKKAEDSNSPFHFNYFSLDFNEEFSAFSGQALYDQTDFTHVCIKKILSLYKGAVSPPKSVVLVGHSMGGMVARAVFTKPDFKPQLVTTIITQATPHQAPVVAIDPAIQTFYDEVNDFWRSKVNTTVSEVTVFSSGGGFRDVMVRSGLTSVNGIVKGDRSLSTDTMSIPRAWVSTDHLCHVWCKQVVLATKRAMFDMVDRSTKQIAVSPFYRWSAFLHHFHKNPGPKNFKGAYDKTTALDKNINWEIRKKLSWKFWKASLPKTRYSVTEIPPSMVPAEYAEPQWGYVAISNIENEKWLGTCSMKEKVDPTKPVKPKKKSKEPVKKQCSEVTNHAPYADLLPPLYSDKKVVHLDDSVLKDATHIVSVLPKTKKRVEIYSELYPLSERHLEYNTSGVVDFLLGFPRSLMSVDIIVNKTAPGAIFYNITLGGLEIPLQAYTVHLTSVRCTEDAPAFTSGAILKLHVPWSHDHTSKFIRSGENGTLPLKLMTPKPSLLAPPAQLHVYLLPSCTYRLSVTTAWSELLGQFIRFYGLYIPGYAAIQVLMALSWQLKMLDEQGQAPTFAASHTRWAQPYRVVPLALLLRFMLYFPEDDNVSLKLGVPRDDRAALESRGLWYAALPIALYLSMYAVVGLYGPLVHWLLAMAGRVTGSVFRCLLYPRVRAALCRLQYALYVLGLVLALFVCGTLGIAIVYFVTVLKTVGLAALTRSSPRQPDAAWSQYNIHVSLVLLLVLSVLLNSPALLTWAHNIQYSGVLEMDPSRTLGAVVCVSAVILTRIHFPAFHGEMYGIASALLYMICVLMVMYATSSVYRVTYFLYAAFIVMATCAVLSMLLEGNPNRKNPAEIPEEETKEKAAEKKSN